MVCGLWKSRRENIRFWNWDCFFLFFFKEKKILFEEKILLDLFFTNLSSKGLRDINKKNRMKMQLIMKEGMQLKFLRGGNSCDEIFTNR